MTTTTNGSAPLPASAALGAVLHTLLWQHKVSQAAAARALGKRTPTVVGKKLRGEVPITIDELMIFAGLVETEPAELLRRSTLVMGHDDAEHGRRSTVGM